MNKPTQYIKGYTEFYEQSSQDSQNIPIQYKQGFCEFYKLKFRVTPNVLIPRPETELLVDEVLKQVQSEKPALSAGRCKVKSQQDSTLIIEIGTGSGCIAISIAGNIGGCNLKIIATDISEKALKVACQNAKLHGVEDRIEFIKRDLLSNVIRHRSFANAQDDNIIIVSNLPYIPTSRISHLDSSVKDFEPHIALDGGSDGFELYRKLFAQIKEKEFNPKLIICEIDDTHGKLALKEAKKYFPNSRIEVKRDLAGKNRILIIDLVGFQVPLKY